MNNQNLGFPYNIFMDLGIDNPSDDQIRGLYFVIANLDPDLTNVVELWYKSECSYELVSKITGESLQDICRKLKEFLSVCSKETCIRKGYKKWRSSMLKKGTIDNSFELVYQRVMSGKEKNNANILLVKDYLFDVTKIPESLKSVVFGYGAMQNLSAFPVLYKTVKALKQSRLCREHDNITVTSLFSSDEDNVYYLLFNIYLNPYCLLNIRNCGKVCISDLLSVLYNKGYISEEQLRFLYFYLPVSWVKSLDELKNFYFTYNGPMHRIG